jgi:hypothetical protein
MTDDFTRIRGVSPKIAIRLQEAGILTYEKLARMTPDEIVARIGPTSGIAERISRHDWIGQAAKLADEQNKKTQGSGETGGGTDLHAMNYMIELFLDESNHVCRTRIHHVQSDTEEAWDNWDEARLVAFFKRRQELRLVKPIQAAQAAEPTTLSQSAEIEAKPATATTSAFASTVISMTKADETSKPIGKLRLQKLEIIPAQFDFPSRSFDHRLAFDVRLYLDLAEMKPYGQELFDYSLTVLTKSLNGERRQEFIKDQGTIRPADSLTLNLKWPSLPPGIYRIAAALTLSPQAADVALQRYLTASLEGGLFEVY